MMGDVNQLGQPIGEVVSGWQGAQLPNRDAIKGTWCHLEPLEAGRHAAALYSAYAENRDGTNWTYLPYGPFADPPAYRVWAHWAEQVSDTFFFAILDSATKTPIGVASFLRAAPDAGTIEVGHLNYSPLLQGTVKSTEAMYLMMRRVFEDWGYRRYEWKCHRLNAPSMAAAKRLGFRLEGVFRNHVIVKGRNRDTAWFSMTDEEWPAIRDAMKAWLDPANFEEAGAQKKRLGELMPATAGTPIVIETSSD
jgi:RimJ/RimL family protein N-acetyltransferase